MINENNFKIIWFIVFFAIIVLLYLWFSFKNMDFKSYEKRRAIIYSKNGEKKGELKLYVAKTIAQKAKGLMFIDEINEDEGMLFLMGYGKHKFWMKNVKFNLYAIGLDEDEVVDIKRMEVCENECKNYEIFGEKVIEINEKGFKKYNISVGDMIVIEKIKY